MRRWQFRNASPGSGRLSMVVLILFVLGLFTPFTGTQANAQDAAPADAEVIEPAAEEPVPSVPPAVEQPVEVPDQQQEQIPEPVATGSLEVRLTGSNGVALSGRFVVHDAAGQVYDRWTDGGVAWFPDLVAGTATVYQVSGTTDFAFSDADPAYVDVPAHGHAVLPVTNPFLDADGDTIGDSVDICAGGDDALDTDRDATPDACDETAAGDPTEEPVPTGTPAGDATSEIAVEVAAEPVVVEQARVSCELAEGASPWIATDLDDYPPGSRVTLTGGNWVAGQVVDILVEDDGLADAERGPWSHTATVAADAQGAFTYQFDLAPWYVADYSVVATGECAEASASFTDAHVLSASLNPMQVPPSSPISFSMVVANANTGIEAINPAAGLGCVQISLPTNGANGYTAIAASTIHASSGKSWSVQAVVENGANTWIVATANGDASRLGVGDQVTIGFSATTPANSGTRPISVAARTSTASPCSSGGQGFNGHTFNVNVVQGSLTAAAAISPNGVPVLAPQRYTVRITNTGQNPMGSAKILIPTGFTTPILIAFSGSGFVSGTPTWSPTYDGADRTIQVDAGTDTRRIAPGGFIEVSFTTAAPLTTGPRTFTIEAWTDTRFEGNQFGFASQPFVTVTTGLISTTTTLSRTEGDSPSAYGQPVTFTAAVTAAGGNPNGAGTVTFRDGATVLCSGVALSGNSASCSITNLAVGSHGITAEYSGTTIGALVYASSTSATLPHTVTRAQQAALAVTGPSSATYGSGPRTPGVAGGSGTGAVTFAVTSGSTACAIQGNQLVITSGTGLCSITATKAADATYESVTSPPFTLAVAKATTTVTLGALDHVHDGTGKGATVTTSPAGLAVTVTYDGGTALPVAAGSYAVVATVTDPNYQGVARDTLVIAAAPPCTPTIGVASGNANFGSLAWEGSGYPTGTGSLAIQVGASGGSGCMGFPATWSVRMSAGDMIRTGGGGTIPANAMTYTGTAAGSPPAGLTPAGASVLGPNAQTIATGNATTATGTWIVGLALVPPAATAPGNYTGTITITVTAGS